MLKNEHALFLIKNERIHFRQTNLHMEEIEPHLTLPRSNLNPTLPPTLISPLTRPVSTNLISSRYLDSLVLQSPHPKLMLILSAMTRGTTSFESYITLVLQPYDRSRETTYHVR